VDRHVEAKPKRAIITVCWKRRLRRWAVSGPLDGTDRRVQVLFKDKIEAVQAGVDAAKAQKPSELRVYRKRGKGSKDARSYGTDPRRSRG